MVFSTLMAALWALLTPWTLHHADPIGIIVILLGVAAQLLRRRQAAPG
jgi:hypothetical protein